VASTSREDHLRCATTAGCPVLLALLFLVFQVLVVGNHTYFLDMVTCEGRVLTDPYEFVWSTQLSEYLELIRTDSQDG
jgi:hypothetical protein